MMEGTIKDLQSILGVLESFGASQNDTDKVKSLIKREENTVHLQNVSVFKLQELLADLEHRQWIEWSKSLKYDLDMLLKLGFKFERILNQKSKISEEELEEFKTMLEHFDQKLKSWECLYVPYGELSEEMKEEDRVYAKKVLDIILFKG